jgi:hypothetical protein
MRPRTQEETDHAAARALAAGEVELAALGAASLAHWVASEVRRIDEELDRVRALSPTEQVAREALPTLRRDPRTRDYRVM